MSEMLLEARELRKSFHSSNQEFEVLRGVNLTLRRGEMVALLGVSGTGKSTLIQILGALDRPSSGTVVVDGTDLFALSQNKCAAFRNRRIGFIYQSHRLLPEFSAIENVMLPLLIGRSPRREALARAEQALHEVELAHRLHHRPGQMSGGEQQRVAIARAVVSNPDLLLADEPTGNLDRKTAQGVFHLLKELNRSKGLTCLMVTHNMELAADLDRRIHLIDGQLVEGHEQH
ncbi:ABC transporter ATP-binding protein [Candidatus Magnetaquicoccus inordinatus]|uniref:ABC transporter ATP-binding protein n=1 Tax=Candidatus Magnetaquicoccus inordinatus TaxID=2496818 RepID=UPI00102BC085|nr:ABC transporter ATP-binding protein [Candidatus Magnetaquicoccus inordinatus]